MYSYQHKYHAGNFADLHKHLTLIAILKHLHKKPAPFCAIDLFAGDGLYDLTTSEAQKNQEYLSGFGLLKNLASLPEMTADNTNLFQELLNLASENIYPGSPQIIKSFLRELDRGIFIENHPQSYAALASNFRYHNIKTYKNNAYETINSFVPYNETRGLVLIDPSYEVKSEYQDIVDLVYETFLRKPTGIYVLWYPILAHNNHYKKIYSLIDKVEQKHNCTIWQHELMSSLSDTSKDNMGMIGSGIIVLNMPWMVDVLLEQHFELVKDLI